MGTANNLPGLRPFGEPEPRKHHTNIHSTGAGEIIVGTHPDDGEGAKIVSDTLVNLEKVL